MIIDKCLMKTLIPDRILRFEGAKNVRDLGGLPTLHGSTTRFGVVFRGDGLWRLTAADLDHLDTLGLRTVIDLRDDSERVSAPDRMPAANPPRLIHCGFMPSRSKNLLEALNIKRVGGAEAARLMCEIYAHVPFEHSAAFGNVLRHLIVPGSAPHLIHCTGGKDRTGLMVSFILYAIGVPKDAIIADYELSNGGTPPTDVFLPGVSKDAIAAAKAASAEYLLAAFNAIDARCGSLDSYLENVLGFDRHARAALSELLVV